MTFNFIYYTEFKSILTMNSTHTLSSEDLSSGTSLWYGYITAPACATFSFTDFLYVGDGSTFHRSSIMAMYEPVVNTSDFTIPISE